MQTPEPRFYLKQPTATIPTLICMQVKYCGQRVFISTGEHVIPADWDFDRQRVTITRKNLSASTTNMFLDRIVNDFKKIFRDLLVSYDLPDAKLVTELLVEKLDAPFKAAKEKVEVSDKITFFKFIENYIEECKTIKNISTVKTYTSTLNHLKGFAASVNKVEFSFEDITIEWRNMLFKYLQDNGAAINTIAKQIKNVKLFLNEATERKINSNMEFRSKKFSKPSEDVEKIFLTIDEIQKIIDLDLSNDKTKDIVRDYFLISCFTSLRYSDFTNIRPENIKENTIELKTEKTRTDVIIPINNVVRTIFNKYSNQLPKAPCNQVFNSVLKEVCRLAGLTDKVTITKSMKGVKQSITYEKFELVSCHTGRRSLITNCILKGVSTSSIMLISGHRNLKVFQGYNKSSKSQNAEALASHAFFQ